MAKAKALDPVTRYATSVVAGKIVAGRLVRLAAQRHLNDLRDAKTKGLVWKPAEAQAVIDFFAEVLCLPEETAAAESVAETDDEPVEASPFILSPHQQFINGSIMGWYTTKGYRRFRDSYIEGAKGDGKTPNGAGLMLYLLVADGERGAQIFFAASGKDQSKLAFADAVKMVDNSPYLKDLIEQTVNNLAVLETGSFLRAISAYKAGLSGKRIHGALIDEEHEHPDGVLVSKIRKGTKGRRNAHIMRTTNSGFDRTSICWYDHEYSRQVLEGTVEDPSWFAFVCGIDPCAACLDRGQHFPSEDCPDCDDWKTEGPHWLKACPNLGVSVSWQYYRELVRQAIGRPDAVSDLLRFNFCVWTSATSRAISMGRWAGCQPLPTEAELTAAPCYGGLDLGETDDFSAWARLWVLTDGRVATKVRYWVPSSALERFPNRPYAEWKRSGLLDVTDGDTTDYAKVRATILEDCAADGVKSIAYDTRSAKETAQILMAAGIDMVPTLQGFALDEAITRFLALVVDGTFCHGKADLILTWMASNFVLMTGRKGEKRIAKERSPEKIDGIAAIITGIDWAIVRKPIAPPNVYASGQPVRTLGE